MAKKSKHRVLKRIVWSLIIVALMWVSFGAGLYLSGKNEAVEKLALDEAVFVGKILGKYNEDTPEELSQDVDFDLFWEVWDSLGDYYVDQDKLNEKKMFYGALKGLVSAVGDPYTVFMDPKIASDFAQDLAGTFEGIGAEIGIKNDILTIIAPLPDMPAEKAGLKAGDKVLAIDDESTAGITIDAAVNKIRGPKGSTVKLTISRNGMETLEEIEIKRGKIIVKSIRTEFREDNVYVIKITNFNEDTEGLFNRAVRDVIKKNPAGIILDLRNNPGGFLDTAIEVSSEWVDDKPVVIEKYSDDKKIEHLARGRARLAGFKTVVLVNQGSASASEIVAGALQDHEKARVVGMKTFGKGSVQTLSEFDDGSSIKITVAKWLTPNGRSINDEGIEPDDEVDLKKEDYEADRDPQFDKAIEILTGVVAEYETEEDMATSTTEENSK